MRQSFRPGRPGPAALAALVSLSLLAGCGDNGSDSDINSSTTGGAGKLSIACPGNVTAGVKIVNGFSVSLLGTNNAGVANTFVSVNTVPNQGSVYAPAESSTATFGGNTDTSGQLTFGYMAPANATQGTVYQVVAKSGSLTASCQVTVQTPSLSFSAPSNGNVYNTCTPVRLRVSSTANGDATVKVASTVDLTASNGAFFTDSSATPASCSASSGSTTRTGVGISGTTGDFQNPIYVVSPSVGGVTVTATDSNNTTRSASVTPQFTTTVAQIVLSNSPTQVYTTSSTSTNAGASSTTISATVYDVNGKLVAGIPLSFRLTTPVSANSNGNKDTVSPPVSTTNTSGIATATYSAGSTLDNGQASANAVVTVSTQDGSVSQTRTITVNR